MWSRRNRRVAAKRPVDFELDAERFRFSLCWREDSLATVGQRRLAPESQRWAEAWRCGGVEAYQNSSAGKVLDSYWMDVWHVGESRAFQVELVLVRRIVRDDRLSVVTMVDGLHGEKKKANTESLTDCHRFFPRTRTCLLLNDMN